MHVYFSGIGGSGISSLALMAHQAGFAVSGSDKQAGAYTDYLQHHGVTDIAIDQSYEHIQAAHAAHPIDWFVYSPAVAMEQADFPELRFCNEHGIKATKRDEFHNMLLDTTHQKLIAVAGTHGKSTTTAMVVWLCKAVGLAANYSLGAKISFGPLSVFDPKAEYFVYECDEFDRNFLAFHPHLSAITGIGWDHHEIYPTQNDYNQAFRDFIAQSNHTIAWQRDLDRLELAAAETITPLSLHDPQIEQLALPGRFNREDAWLAVQTVSRITGQPVSALIPHINDFPGLKQRMEQLAPNLYSNYAHTPEKIAGGISAALDIAKQNGGQRLVVVYEPLTNRRQHYIKDDYKDVFQAAEKVYWVPTYLAREDPTLPMLTPDELIKHLNDPSKAEPAELDEALVTRIREHLAAGDLVVAMGASGTGSMDEWLRAHFSNQPS